MQQFAAFSHTSDPITAARVGVEVEVLEGGSEPGPLGMAQRSAHILRYGLLIYAI